MREEQAETCILCGSPGRVIHASVRDNLFGVAGEWRVRSCPDAQCGLCWLDPKPIADDLHESYSHYFTHDTTTDKSPHTFNVPLRRIVRTLERMWLTLLGQWKSRRDIERMFLTSDAPGKVLEVGCGDGSSPGGARRARMVRPRAGGGRAGCCTGWLARSSRLRGPAPTARPPHRRVRRRRDEPRPRTPPRPRSCSRRVPPHPQTWWALRGDDAQHRQPRPPEVWFLLDRTRRSTPPASLPTCCRPSNSTARWVRAVCRLHKFGTGWLFPGCQPRGRGRGPQDGWLRVCKVRAERDLVPVDRAARTGQVEKLRRRDRPAGTLTRAHVAFTSVNDLNAQVSSPACDRRPGCGDVARLRPPRRAGGRPPRRAVGCAPPAG